MANRLAETTSPYLLQHKDNPIDWFPWSDEAWAKAESEGKPVFLSIGYSSCHWCHVMAHESFEDPEVALALNRDFVSIKLDREERPDVDEVYMTAVQMATGHGGWPMSLFLTPAKKPFFAGTYFPRESRGQFPGFLTIIGSLAKAWREQMSEVLKSADEFGVALSAALERTLPTDLQGLDVGILDQAVEILHQEFDFDNGGFGGKPKFPPHAAFRFLLDYAAMRDSMGGDAGDLPARAGHMALFTLEKIALGGIHDHVGGGFHRYATDERWFLPHFEKMLYDNAQLISAFHHATEASEDERLVSLLTRVTERAVDWLFREMRSEDGLFMSALDADSEGREGAYYVWTKGQIDQLVEDSAAFCKSFGVVDEGNFDEEATGQKTGENVLWLEVDEGDKWGANLSELLKARDSRPRPGLDFKAVAAWNGLIISALSQTGYLDAAQECAKAWRQFGGTPPHMITNGVASGLAFLDDVACLADGFLDLFEASGEVEWSDAAKQLADTLEQKFLDPSGGFTYLSSEHEALFGRTKPYMDNATPSPIGTAARVMRRLGRIEPAIGAVTSGLGWVQRAPRATDTLLREILWMLWNNDGTDTELLGSKQAVELSARLEPRVIHEDSEGWAHTEVVVDIPEGFHINSNEPLAKWLTATSLTADEAFAEAAYPEAPTGVYSDQLRIAVRLRRRAKDGAFRLVLRYQACTDSECLLPTEVSLDGEFANP